MRKQLFAGLLLLGIAACAHTTRQVTRTESVTVVGDRTPGVTVTPARVAGTLSSGTKVTVLLQDQITASRNHVGDLVPAVIERDVKDGEGRLLFPAGTEAQIRIAAIVPATKHQDDGGFTLELTNASVNGQMFYVGPKVEPAGAAVSGLISGSVRGAVVGGMVGATTENNLPDLVVRQGTKVDFKLEQPVVVLTS